MSKIKILDKKTIDKIAAGEVIERPANVVKELMENSIDAGAGVISIEISEGGTDFIRISDNGCGIEKDEVRSAFLSHSTSKISTAEDLSFIRTLGFRGEALSSIAAVSKVELCTKVKDALTGVIYKIEGGDDVSFSDAGLPCGTTIIVRDLFYNTPARRKFLKSKNTEASKAADIVMKTALSNPDISFKLAINGKVRISTGGNGSLKDAVYAVYGRDIAASLLDVNFRSDFTEISGYIAKPETSRGNRAMELFFVNGRLVNNLSVSRAIEDAYSGFQMKGSFPVTFLKINIEPELVDVNVHPSKTEVRFNDTEEIYRCVNKAVRDVLSSRESIPYFTVRESVNNEPDRAEPPNIKVYSVAFVPEPFEEKRLESIKSQDSPMAEAPYEQIEFQSPEFLSVKSVSDHKIIGMIFDTYWIVEFADKIYLIDQHAAHEKVLYERFLAEIKSGEHYSQILSPPLIVSLNPVEETVLSENIEIFNGIGFEINHFGGSEYAVSAVPSDMYTLNDAELFLSFISELSGEAGRFSSEMLLDKIASAACKSAVKGGNRLSISEAKQLINDLLSLDNPYNCPHGRPTIITMTKAELERKFKRLV